MKKLVRFYGKEQQLYPSVLTSNCKQESNFKIQNKLSILNSFVFQLLKAGLMVLAFCLLGTTQNNAQRYTSNLSQSVDKESIGIEDRDIFTSTINPDAGATASDIVETATISSGLTDIMLALVADDFNSSVANIVNCPDVTISTNLENICQGESVPLSVVTTTTLPVTYKWTPSRGLSDPFIANPVATPNVSTTYVVETNLGNGVCVQYDTVNVNVFDIPNPDFHANEVCVGQPTVFDDETVTYTTLTRWTWDFGDGIGTSIDQNPSYTYQNAGNYLVKLIVESTNGCIDSSWQEITVNSGVSIIAGMEDASTCRASAMPVSITMSEAIAQYTIAGSGGYLAANVSGATLTFDAYLNGVVSNFSVTLENADGCSVDDEFAIIQAADPKAEFIVHNPTCAETDVTVEFTGNASPEAILTWDLAGATLVSSSAATATAPAGANLVVQWPTSGGKTISLAINDGGCEDRKTQNINVNKLPFADAGLDVSICSGECVELQGVGNGSQYLWSPAIGLSATDIPNPTACPPTTTTYQLLVMEVDGCMVMDEVTVSVTSELTASVELDQPVCGGNTVQLNASGGTSYSWTPTAGLNNPTIANPTASQRI